MNLIKNKRIWFLFSSFLLFLMFPLISTAVIDCNVTFPSILSDRTIINVSMNVTEGAEAYNMSVAIYLANSSISQNTTPMLIANATNSSGRRFVNISFPLFDELIIQDSNDYRGYAVCYENTTLEFGNAISEQQSSQTDNIRIDRTKPSKPTSITFTNPLKDGDAITATINRSAANRCFIQFGGGSKLAMTLSGSTCTFTVGKNNPVNSDYQTVVIADDRTNTTNSDTQYITIRAVTSDGGGLLGGSQFQLPPQQGGLSAFGIGTRNPFMPNEKLNMPLIIGIIIFVYLFINRKK